MYKQFIFLLFLFFILFGINFSVWLLIIPFNIIYLFYPKYLYLVFFFKNTLISAFSFYLHTWLFKNIYINSVDNFNDFNSVNKKIIISNHPTELDFIFLLIFLNNDSNFFKKNIFVVKKMLGVQILALGIIGLFTNDIFLNRKLHSDFKKLSSIRKFDSLILFPEGTCFTNHKKKLSDSYCKKNNLITFKYLLYPRVTGLKLILQNNPNINFIYDLTIYYDSIQKRKIGSAHYDIFYFIFHNLPNKIFIRFAKYPIASSVVDKQLEQIFASKDSFINNFDPFNNKFVPFVYDFYNGFSSFILICFISLLSFYIIYKYSFFKILLVFETICFYFYFIFFK